MVRYSFRGQAVRPGTGWFPFGRAVGGLADVGEQTVAAYSQVFRGKRAQAGLLPGPQLMLGAPRRGTYPYQ